MGPGWLATRGHSFTREAEVRAKATKQMHATPLRLCSLSVGSKFGFQGLIFFLGGYLLCAPGRKAPPKTALGLMVSGFDGVALWLVCGAATRVLCSSDKCINCISVSAKPLDHQSFKPKGSSAKQKEVTPKPYAHISPA